MFPKVLLEPTASSDRVARLRVARPPPARLCAEPDSEPSLETMGLGSERDNYYYTRKSSEASNQISFIRHAAFIVYLF